MSALLVAQPKTGALTPIDLPRLRAVSPKAPLDVPNLAVPEAEHSVRLRAVPAPVEAEQHERAHELAGLEKLVGALKVGIIISASVAFALSLELWLTF